MKECDFTGIQIYTQRIKQSIEMIPKKVYVLKLSEKEFKAAFINIFNVLKQNLVKMVEDLGNISSKIETETEKKRKFYEN